MKRPIYHFSLLIFLILLSCAESKNDEKIEPPKSLPFDVLELNDMTNFKPVAGNWRIVGNAFVDRSKARSVSSEPGTGVLLNNPENGMKDNLFTAFEHADIEMELDVMMPVNSNSGLYFQGRYEIQLLDSWGVEEPYYGDIGGVYERGGKGNDVAEYQGFPPRVNAARAPGLWQHFKINFKAPEFDANGNKTKNAVFKEVWLNGTLIHENQEVTGPTRASAFGDEKPRGPLMIQGDHGPVAFKNIRCKLYDNGKVTLRDLVMKEFEPYSNQPRTIPGYDTMSVENEVASDSISALMVSGDNPTKLAIFNGKFHIPVSGDYIFEMRLQGAGAVLLIGKDTVVNLNGDFWSGTSRHNLINLQKGDVPFSLIYNKHRPNQRGLYLAVEGPGIAKHHLHAPGSFPFSDGGGAILPLKSEEITLQRGFIMHHGEKRTHAISVGSPEGIHYAYDLANSALLYLWSGDFLNVAGMWQGRGHQQLMEPLGITLSFHGTPEFADLKNQNEVWPDSISPDGSYRQMGYELDKSGNPTFMMNINGKVVSSAFIPLDSTRSIKRIITKGSEGAIWHKLGGGKSIEELPDGTYGIDDRSFYLDFSENNLQPIIRNSGEGQELIVEIPTGDQKISYTLIW